MNNNTKLLLLIFSILTIGTVAIILSLRPIKNTEAYKDKKAGSTCQNDNDCKSGHCGKFDKKDPKKCCSMKETPWYVPNEYHYKIENGQKFCTELGEGSRCTPNRFQCKSPLKCGWPDGRNFYEGPICGNTI